MKGRIGWQGLKQSEFTMNFNEPYLITGMNFKNGSINWDEVYHVSFERFEAAKEIQIRANDVLMTKDGTIGKLLYISEIPYPGKASLNSHLLVFRPLNNSYIPKFLYYQLASKAFKDYIELIKSGTTFFGISQEAVGNYNVFLPSIPEQEAIAEALSDADALIESLEQLIAKKRQIKKGAMQELLTGKRRLPGFATKLGYKQTEIGIIPEDWNLKSVGDISTTVASGTSRVDSKFGDYPVYGSTGVIGKCTKADYSGKAVLIARVGANAGKLTVVDGEYGVTDNTIILRIDESCILDYFWRQLEAKRLNSMIFGSGQPLITGTQIKSVLFPLPPTKAEQTAIATILSDMDSEITALEEKLAKARQIKQGMMQELLTGRIRLI